VRSKFDAFANAVVCKYVSILPELWYVEDYELTLGCANSEYVVAFDIGIAVAVSQEQWRHLLTGRRARKEQVDAV
jgi:hypothetical protein